MRIKKPFHTYKRTLASGRVVFYYHCWDERTGKRRWGLSTGCDKKTNADMYCMELYRKGLLIPQVKTPTFADFSNGWWDLETSEYLKWRQLTDPLSEGTIDIHRNNYNVHLKDYYGRYLLSEIDAELIKKWLIEMTEKKLAPASINLAYTTLKLMLDEAVRKKLLTANPVKEVKKIKEQKVKRKILSVDEMDALFPENWETIWDNYCAYMASRIASLTGMRIGELRGLRVEHIFNDHVDVIGQYTRHGYKDQTKTKVARQIPIDGEVYALFKLLIDRVGEGFIFSDDGGAAPVRSELIQRQYNKALGAIGISDDDRKTRKLTFHAWRHFINTRLLTENVGREKVQSVTGHLTDKQTDNYTEFNTLEFTEVCAVQKNLLKGKRGKAKADSRTKQAAQ